MFSRNHKYSVAPVMNRARILRVNGRLRLHDFEDKEIIFRQQLRVGHFAFVIGVTFFYKRRLHDLCVFSGEPEFAELVQMTAGTVPDAYHCVNEIYRGNIDDTFPTLADHLVAVIGGGNHTSDERGRKLHHGMPTHRHDIGLVFPAGAHQDNGAGFQEAADFRYWQIRLFVGSFHMTAIWEFVCNNHTQHLEVQIVAGKNIAATIFTHLSAS